jgi:two-component system response regulator DegU
MVSVLIVEDSEPMRQMIKTLIADVAADVCERGDGREALAAYRVQRPDWVLMDIAMPGVDGIAATREITTAFPDANILIVTDYDDAELREAARQAGACGYVLKENLLEIRELIGKT